MLSAIHSQHPWHCRTASALRAAWPGNVAAPAQRCTVARAGAPPAPRSSSGSPTLAPPAAGPLATGLEYINVVEQVSNAYLASLAVNFQWAGS